MNEIPPNTGNIANATKTELHLIEPLGFTIDNLQTLLASCSLACIKIGKNSVQQSLVGLCFPLPNTASLGANLHILDDILVLGPETRGLPEHILKQDHVRIPIYKTVRSLNLSTAAYINALKLSAKPNNSQHKASTPCEEDKPRLCRVHKYKPLGFTIDNKHLRATSQGYVEYISTSEKI